MKNSMMLKDTIFSLIWVFALLSQQSFAQAWEVTDEEYRLALQQLQSKWFTTINTPEEQIIKYGKLQELSKKINKLSMAYPDIAEVKAWNGIILSSFAGVKKSPGGAHIAFSARRILQEAESLQPGILDIADYTGIELNSRKSTVTVSARKALKRALAYNPGGIDIQHYYGAFLPELSLGLLASREKTGIEQLSAQSFRGLFR